METASRREVPAAPPLAEARMGAGLWASILLHVILLAGLIWIGWPRRDDARDVPPISVDLVTLGPTTESPRAALRADVPQQRAAEISDRAWRKAIPPKATATAAAQDAASTAAGTGRKTSPKSMAASKVVAAAQQDDPLSKRLQQLAKLAEPSARLVPEPNTQPGSGLSNVTASNGSATGPDAAYGIKDFIRAQAMRRWYVADPVPISKGWTVSIHMKLRRDGTVALAEVVDMGRYRTDRKYFDFALSARNAVLLSSPFTIPSGAYAYAKDLVLEFDPRAVLQ
ncbi:MAG TPA: hypothetical protein VHA35_23490 [Dongiaceae bacterium]|jgi:hypothetical protein|nr:hypothetical protein [Dongiaceae bacterium]